MALAVMMATIIWYWLPAPFRSLVKGVAGFWNLCVLPYLYYVYLQPGRWWPLIVGSGLLLATILVLFAAVPLYQAKREIKRYLRRTKEAVVYDDVYDDGYADYLQSQRDYGVEDNPGRDE